MLHGDIAPSPGADGVSDTPGHAAASATRGHGSQVTGQGKHMAAGVGAAPGPRVTRGQAQSSAPAPGDPPGPGAICQTGEGFTQPPSSRFLAAPLIQHLGRWGKATHSNDFSYCGIKPILGDRCLSVSVLSIALTRLEYFI